MKNVLITFPRILEYYSLATEHDKAWYKAWHMWALMNYESVLFYKQKDAGSASQNQEVNLPLTPRPDTVCNSFEKIKFLISQENPMVWPFIGIISKRRFQ